MDAFSSHSIKTEILREQSPIPVSSVSPNVLPAAVPEIGLFPSALVSNETSVLFPVSNLRDEIIGDELDLILDSVPTSNSLLVRLIKCLKYKDIL